MQNVAKVVIERDNDPIDPREYYHLGTMVCFHRRYNLGDKHNLSLEEAQSLEHKKDVISLPLYLYDHSGITIATKPFNCPWDSGKVGFIYVTKQEAREWLGVKLITKKLRERIIDALNVEVKEYDYYLRGEVYCVAQYDANGEQVGCSCEYIDDVDSIVDYAQSIHANAEIVVA